MPRFEHVLFAVVLIGMTITAGTASGEERVFQPGPADGKDSFVYANDPTAANGTLTYLYFGGGAGAGGEMRLYIQFDLSGLDVTSTVVGAQLEFYMGSQSGFINGYNYSVMRITAPWSENTVTWNNQPAFDPLAVTAFSGDAWQGQIGTWQAITGLQELVQFWVENPDENHGLLIKPTSGFYGYPLLWSSDYSNAARRPILRIDGDIVPAESESWSAVKALY